MTVTQSKTNWTTHDLNDLADLVSPLATTGVLLDPTTGVPLHLAPMVSLAKPTNSSVVTNFDSGHGYTAPAPSPVGNNDDTSVYLYGSQSLRLGTTNGSGTSQTARKTGMGAIDMTGKCFKITIRCDRPLNIANLRFDCSSDSFTNWNKGFLIASNATNLQNPFISPNTWQDVVVPWGLFTVGGGAGATRSAITAVQLLVVDDASGVPIQVWIDRISTVAEPTNTIVTFTFDDGRDGVYLRAKGLLDAQDWRATWAPIVDKVGVTNYMTLDQNKALLDSGWDPAVHAYGSSAHNNFDTIDDATAVQDMILAKGWMRANGFGPADAYLVPKGATYASTAPSDTRDKMIRKLFYCARNTVTSVREMYAPGRPWNLRCYNPGNKSVATVEGIIDEAVTNKEWLILQLHDIPVTATSDPNDVTSANLSTLVTYIAGKSNTKVKSLAEVQATGAA